MSKLHSRGITVHMYWTVGHVNLPGNELADRLAKEASTQSKSGESDDTHIPVSEMKNILRKTLVKRWQKRWDTGIDARFSYLLIPQITQGN